MRGNHCCSIKTFSFTIYTS